MKNRRNKNVVAVDSVYSYGGVAEQREVDMVNSPPHYAASAVECIEAIQASMSGVQFRGYCKGCVMKYLWRWENKGGVEDLRKAEWYLKRLIRATGEPEEEVGK